MSRTHAKPEAIFAVLLVPVLLAATLILGGCKSQAPLLKPPVPGQKAVPQEVQDHAATGFPLNGRHAQLDCDACHGKKDPKPACQSCHTPPHDAKFKKTCEDCHTAGMPFVQVKYRHPAKDLWTFHADVGCVECHENRKFLKASRNCTGCHADFHKGSVGRDCYECHRQPAWNVNRFNHNQTGFPLMGTHRALDCGDCHRDIQSFRIVPRPTSCASCHESDYRSAPFPHGAYGAGHECQECHLQDTWSYAHSPFWFNIQTGNMAGVACASCHKTTGNYRDYTCHDCHKGHTGDRNGRCVDCHPNGFPGGSPAPAGTRGTL
jgi:hypothetical protein